MATSSKITDELAVVDAHEDSGEVIRDKLLRDLKKEVKQIMEEAVTRRFVQEESNYVTSLSATVEACLAYGLKRRLLGLFGTSSTFALLHKISKLCPPAASVLKSVIAMQQLELKEHCKSGSSLDRFRSTSTSVKDLPVRARFLWIRVALYEKLLATIVDYIARNAHRYYDNEALMMDPVRGGMVAALLVGPCALDFTKMKTVDNYWTDPTADELVQRHRIHSGTPVSATDSPKSPRRPALSVVKRGSSLVSTSDVDPSSAKLATCGREYVFSLHQNLKSTLLYGKNNVTVSPADHSTPLKGYLSLHQNTNGTLSIKWTPNELMHSNSQPNHVPPTPQHFDRNSLWRYAINLNVDEIIYLHFHQKGDSGGSIVFVGADGVQHPPIQFPAGQHPLSFLSCLENGLLPWGQLDPPLWLQKGKGKVFPKLRRKTSTSNGRFLGHDFQQQIAASETASIASSEDVEGIQSDEPHDYVFRIVPVMQARAIASELSRRAAQSTTGNSSRLVALSGFSSLLKERFMSMSSSPNSSPPPTPPTAGSGDSAISAFRPPETASAPTSPPIDPDNDEHRAVGKRNSEPIAVPEPESSSVIEGDGDRDGDIVTRSNLLLACDSMRNQILSRAFYGWLAHCRHLKTVRNHLSCLLMKQPVEPIDEGVTEEVWHRLYADRTTEAEEELLRRTYFGGVSPALRVHVWPYLLGFVQWTEVVEEKLAVLKINFEGMMTDWMAVEAIVRQKDKEAFDAARIRYDSHGGDLSLTGRDTSLRNDVFGSEDDCSEVCLGETDSTDQPQPPLSASRMDSCEAPRLPASGRSTPVEGDGGIFTKELIDMFALNLHRIEKDVHRCDRNYPYFTSNENLEKLKNVMCTYVWEHLDHGYVQGMCDLAAPLLVVFDDEVLTYGCFKKIMDRMTVNFPHGGGMDEHLANLRALMQVMDSELFDLIHHNGDYTHFYFCYRWFLLDFKRELAYEDVFLVWETIWAAARCASAHFQLFFALGLMLAYRDIILGNNMDFTDIIKFFNEMAERHDAMAALRCAREQVRRLQLLMLDSNIP